METSSAESDHTPIENNTMCHPRLNMDRQLFAFMDSHRRATLDALRGKVEAAGLYEEATPGQ